MNEHKFPEEEFNVGTYRYQVIGDQNEGAETWIVRRVGKDGIVKLPRVYDKLSQARYEILLDLEDLLSHPVK